MLRTLPHILSRVFGPPLLIAPTPLEGLLAGLQAAMLHRGPSEPQMAVVVDAGEAPSSDERPRGYRIDRGVATVPVHGVLMRRSGEIDAESRPLQSYENVGRVLRAAQRDSRVRGILLDVDSPGGEAGGVFDLAREIRLAARRKPVWAIANDDALSAAYILASAADRVWATETASLGSLGVVALHADQSALDADMGLKYTYIYKGARKIDAHPHGALTSEAQNAIQAEVDRLYDKLVTMVAEHRHAEPARIRCTEAAVYFGERALGQGLADRIGTIDEAHAALVEHTTTQRGPRMDTTTTAPPPGTAENQQAAPPPQAQTPPPPPPADTGNVVQLARDEAATAARQMAREIAELCALAKLPHLAAGFIGEGLKPDAVRQKLQEAQAAAAAKQTIVSIDTTAQTPPGTIDLLNKAVAARLQAMSSAHPRR